jgi:hypothetical protein
VEWIADNPTKKTTNQAAVMCTYNQDQIVTDDLDASLVRINKWYQKFILNPQVQDSNAQIMYNQLLTDLATRQTTTACMTNPFGKGDMPRCSILNSSSPTGNTVRSWFELQPEHVKDYIKTTYCTRYKDDQSTDECACINRDQYPMFQQISGDLKTQGNGGIEATCWWAGCMDGNKFFIRSDEPKCGVTNVCQVINQFIDDNIDQSTFNSQTSCTYNNPGGGGGGSGGGSGKTGVLWKDLLNLFNTHPKEGSAALIAMAVLLLLLSFV